jgi:hypothetical protein
MSVTESCPYMGLDRLGTRASWTTGMHRCYTKGGERRRIAPLYQQYFCFGPAHTTCPYFLAAAEEQ